MEPVLRPFALDDYPWIAEVQNAVHLEYPVSAEELRFNDEHDDPKCRHGRWVAEVGGQVMGTATYGQHRGMYHPQKFLLDLVVRPESQGQGIGAALYEQLVAGLTPFDPIALRFEPVRSDQARAIRFLGDRGFVEESRNWESRLDVRVFESAPFTDVVKRVAAQGITIESTATLRDDPLRNRKLFDLHEDISVDVPHPDPILPGSFETFVDRIFNDPNYQENGYFVAIQEGRYIGQTNLWRSTGNNNLYVGLTGVRREFRRRGIALAMKLRAIAWARENGFNVMKTWNESTNQGMMSVNERLGFVKQLPWITFVKNLR